jgi:hypothetical protein
MSSSNEGPFKAVTLSTTLRGMMRYSVGADGLSELVVARARRRRLGEKVNRMPSRDEDRFANGRVDSRMLYHFVSSYCGAQDLDRYVP